MRSAHITIAIVFLLGAVVWGIGAVMPVYTDPKAPERLSLELQDRPREVRFTQWYEGLQRYETPHKRLTDGGRGLMALALGILLAMALTSLYLHFMDGADRLFFTLAWLGLWAIKIPLSGWYYGVRQQRFDYPVWGDSIAIGVMSEAFAWVMGALISGAAIWVLMLRHRFQPALRVAIWPAGWLSRSRAVVIYLWLLLLLFCIVSAIPDGNEGMTISCTGALPLLLAVLNAKLDRQAEAKALAPTPVELPGV